MSMCERFFFLVIPLLHITKSLSARYPLLCGALLRFITLQIRPAILAIRSAKNENGAGRLNLAILTFQL